MNKIDMLKKFNLDETQVGTTKAQVIILCMRIVKITEHLVPIQINKTDLENMTEKGQNILNSIDTSKSNKKDYSAVRAVKKIMSSIENHFKYLARTKKESEYSEFIKTLKNQFPFIRNKG